MAKNKTPLYCCMLLAYVLSFYAAYAAKPVDDKSWGPQLEIELASGNVFRAARLKALLPMMQSKNDLFAADLRATTYFEEDNKPNLKQISFGLMYRSTIDKSSLAVFGYMDGMIPKINSERIAYAQATTGIQFMTDNIEVEIVLYAPFNPSRTVYTDKYNQVGSGSGAVFYQTATSIKTVPGIEAEAGYINQVAWNISVGAYVGLYSFGISSNDDSIKGYLLRLEGKYAMPDSGFNFRAGFMMQDDNLRQDQYVVYLKIGADTSSRGKRGSMTPLERKLADFIRRDNVLNFVSKETEVPIAMSAFVDAALYSTFADTALYSTFAVADTALYSTFAVADTAPYSTFAVYPDYQVQRSTGRDWSIPSINANTEYPQDVIDNAGPGAMIFIDGDVIITKTLTLLPDQILIGVNNGALYNTPSNSMQPILSVADGDSISNLSLDNSVTTMPALAIGATSNVSLDAITLLPGSRGTGLSLTNTRNTKLSNLVVRSPVNSIIKNGISINGADGLQANYIQLFDTATGVVLNNTTNARISDLSVTGGTNGVVVDGKSDHLVINGITLVNPNGVGISARGSSSGVTVRNVDIVNAGLGFSLFGATGTSSINIEGVVAGQISSLGTIDNNNALVTLSDIKIDHFTSPAINLMGKTSSITINNMHVESLDAELIYVNQDSNTDNINISNSNFAKVTALLSLDGSANNITIEGSNISGDIMRLGDAALIKGVAINQNVFNGGSVLIQSSDSFAGSIENLTLYKNTIESLSSFLNIQGPSSVMNVTISNNAVATLLDSAVTLGSAASVSNFAMRGNKYGSISQPLLTIVGNRSAGENIFTGIKVNDRVSSVPSVNINDVNGLNVKSMTIVGSTSTALNIYKTIGLHINRLLLGKNSGRAINIDDSVNVNIDCVARLTPTEQVGSVQIGNSSNINIEPCKKDETLPIFTNVKTDATSANVNVLGGN